MLFPDDPSKRPELWGYLAAQLSTQLMCYVVCDSIADAKSEARVLPRNALEPLLSRLKGASVCRISANRGQAISPHFSGDMFGSLLKITDFILLPMHNGIISSDQLIRDIETSVVNLFYTEKEVLEICIPLALVPWGMDGAEITNGAGGLRFFKKRNK